MAHYPLPNAQAMPVPDIGSLIQVTGRLNQLALDEYDMLEQRRYQDIAKLQEEKLRLTGQLEGYQHAIALNPDYMKTLDEPTREAVLLSTDDLAYNSQEVFRKLAAARAVNQRIMQAIRDVMSEQHSPTTYGRNGATSSNDSVALSMNLNQKA